MTLNKSAKNQPILYGFLGNNVTYVMIKVTYTAIPCCSYQNPQIPQHLGDDYDDY